MAPTEPRHLPVGHGDDDLFLDPSFETGDVDLNGINPNFYLDPFVVTPPFQNSAASGYAMDFSLGSENLDGPMLDSSTLDYFSNTQHELESLSTPSLCFENSQPIPFLTLSTLTPSCLAENRTPCIVTATQYLRTLHIRQTNCLSHGNRQSSTCQEIDGSEPPRMSGSVLKGTKEAGMSVCRMLQCACALRPQNQLILAVICSRLVAWYRAMIRACFSRHPYSEPGGQNFTEEPALPEKVVHEAVTIGDHTVDNPALGWNIQAQVILGELGHLQRLVDTISVRIQQTVSSHQLGLNADSGAYIPFFGLPDIAHDRLVTHLSKEIEAVKNDLMTALR
ncbi:hypothetical protein N7490_011202 [Penicillium lividum]|nr:hypothetical protein N7490_011202 [Penicillium lividum]